MPGGNGISGYRSFGKDPNITFRKSHLIILVRSWAGPGQICSFGVGLGLTRSPSVFMALVPLPPLAWDSIPHCAVPVEAWPVGDTVQGSHGTPTPA